MPTVEVPVPLATATLKATVDDGSANPPTNVIHEDDNASVRARLKLSGVAWDFATLNWEFKLRIEGNPKAPNVPGDNFVLGPVTKTHNGFPGGSNYTINATIPIPPNTLTVGSEKSQSYEFTLELTAADDGTGEAHGMAGFVDLGDVMVYQAP